MNEQMHKTEQAVNRQGLVDDSLVLSWSPWYGWPPAGCGWKG